MKHTYIFLTVLAALCQAFVHAASERFHTAMEIDSIARNVLNVDSVGVDIMSHNEGDDPRSIFLIDLAKRDRDVLPYPALAVGTVDISFPVESVVLHSDGRHYEWSLEKCQAYYWVYKHISPFLGAVGLCKAVDITSSYPLEPDVYVQAWCATGQ